MSSFCSTFTGAESELIWHRDTIGGSRRYYINDRLTVFFSLVVAILGIVFLVPVILHGLSEALPAL